MLVINEHNVQVHIDDGDVLIFDRPCTSMDPLSAVICIGAKLSTISAWDHVGIVVRGHDGNLNVLEANMSGVTIRPLNDRIKKSKSNKIAVRKLYGAKPPEFSDKLTTLAYSVVGKSYNSSMKDFINALYTSYADYSSYKTLSHIKYISNTLNQLQIELQSINEIHYPLHYHIILHRISDMANNKTYLLDKSKTLLNNSNSKEVYARETYFCSHLVASVYHHLGVIDNIRMQHTYIPAEFSSSSVTQGVILGRGYAFSPDIVFNPKGN
jgi:hypothetical protein